MEYGLVFFFSSCVFCVSVFFVSLSVCLSVYVFCSFVRLFVCSCYAICFPLLLPSFLYSLPTYLFRKNSQIIPSSVFCLYLVFLVFSPSLQISKFSPSL
ncbi:hypothetical protein GGU10DRAFT_367352 [Lentinula aff. detonsa]|uniref:Uncharacterized protein n=1 Tax=Lentinula aff. detonsa TaxID=2804958 RepID=A0AA38KC72_9AGAR|nr:hypothetical protein GGU10DRAFT_367352 [Lentinula aff. detonsa]